MTTKAIPKRYWFLISSLHINTLTLIATHQQVWAACLGACHTRSAFNGTEFANVLISHVHAHYLALTKWARTRNTFMFLLEDILIQHDTYPQYSIAQYSTCMLSWFLACDLHVINKSADCSAMCSNCSNVYMYGWKLASLYSMAIYLSLSSEQVALLVPLFE